MLDNGELKGLKNDLWEDKGNSKNLAVPTRLSTLWREFPLYAGAYQNLDT